MERLEHLEEAVDSKKGLIFKKFCHKNWKFCSYENHENRSILPF